MPKKFIDKVAVLAVPVLVAIFFWITFKVATMPSHCRCHSCDDRTRRVCTCKDQDCGDRACKTRQPQIDTDNRGVR